MLINGFIAEARKKDVTYKIKEVKGKVEKVTAELTSKKSELFTKLAKKYKELDIKLEELSSQREELNAEVKALISDYFDAEDEVFTRVIETVSLTATMSKASKPSEKVNTEAVLEELVKLVPNLTSTVDKLKTQFTTISKPKASTLSIKINEENSFFKKIKAKAHNLLNSIKNWATSYDKKLMRIKHMINPTKISEARSSKMAPGAVDSFHVYAYYNGSKKIKCVLNFNKEDAWHTRKAFGGQLTGLSSLKFERHISPETIVNTLKKHYSQYTFAGPYSGEFTPLNLKDDNSLDESSRFSQDALQLNPDLKKQATKPSRLGVVTRSLAGGIKNLAIGKSDEEYISDLEKKSGNLRPSYRADALRKKPISPKGPSFDRMYEMHDEDYEDEDDNYDGEFYIVINGSFIGKLTKEGSKWVESAVKGEAPYNWGTRYMGYLTPEDVMSWIRKDYRQEVDGPFYSKEDAMLHFSMNENIKSITFKTFLLEYYDVLLEDRLERLKNTIKTIDTSHDENAGITDKNDIIEFFANNIDPSKNKSYVQFLVNLYNNHKFKQSDVERVKAAIHNFDKYRHLLSNEDKNINKFNSIEEIETVIAPHLGAITNRVEWVKNNTKKIDNSHDSMSDITDKDEIIDYIANEMDPTQNKVYIQFLVNMYSNGAFRLEDAPRIKETISLFDKYKNKLSNDKKDINQYDYISDINRAIEPFIGHGVTKADEREISKKSLHIPGKHELVYEDNKIAIYHLKDENTSKHLYASKTAKTPGVFPTDWCTAYTDNRNCMYQRYASQGPLYVIHRKSDGAVFQYHFASNQFQDSRDSGLSDADWDSIKDSVHKAWKENKNLIGL